jgi:hypothetical protein
MTSSVVTIATIETITIKEMIESRMMVRRNPSIEANMNLKKSFIFSNLMLPLQR